MKLSNLFLMAVMVGSLAVLGCGNDGGSAAGSGGSAGSGGTAGDGGSSGGNCANADEICADCASGTPTDDCRQDVALCNTAGRVEVCQFCVDATEPGCDGAGGSGGAAGSGGSAGSGGTAGSGGSSGKDCADADELCAGCAEGPPLNDCRNDVMLCNQLDRCQECIDTNPPGC